MFTKLALATAPLLAFVLAAPAHAETHGAYVGISAGALSGGSLHQSAAGSPNLALDDGSTYAVSAGYDLGMVRLEGEARRLSASTDIFGLSVNTSAMNYSANAYLEPIAFGSFEPYVMGGVGHLEGKAAIAVIGSVKASGTSYTYGAGGNYALSDKVTLDGSWRRIRADNLQGVDFGGDVFSVGARFRIG